MCWPMKASSILRGRERREYASRSMAKMVLNKFWMHPIPEYRKVSQVRLTFLGLIAKSTHEFWKLGISVRQLHINVADVECVH